MKLLVLKHQANLMSRLCERGSLVKIRVDECVEISHSADHDARDIVCPVGLNELVVVGLVIFGGRIRRLRSQHVHRFDKHRIASIRKRNKTMSNSLHRQATKSSLQKKWRSQLHGVLTPPDGRHAYSLVTFRYRFLDLLQGVAITNSHTHHTRNSDSHTERDRSEVTRNRRITSTMIIRPFIDSDLRKNDWKVYATV